jgi:hypothetical protein
MTNHIETRLVDLIGHGATNMQGGEQLAHAPAQVDWRTSRGAICALTALEGLVLVRTGLNAHDTYLAQGCTPPNISISRPAIGDVAPDQQSNLKVN